MKQRIIVVDSTAVAHELKRNGANFVYEVGHSKDAEFCARTSHMTPTTAQAVMLQAAHNLGGTPDALIFHTSIGSGALPHVLFAGVNAPAFLFDAFVKARGKKIILVLGWGREFQEPSIAQDILTAAQVGMATAYSKERGVTTVLITHAETILDRSIAVWEAISKALETKKSGVIESGRGE